MPSYGRRFLAGGRAIRPPARDRAAGARDGGAALSVGAARRLIVDRGCVGTTIETIAEEAGVAVPTVYKALGNKRTITRELKARGVMSLGCGERSRGCVRSTP
jgi:AcrR family transcriptional regulator